ncbi:MAG: LysR family transcriptional regulator [Deltaproteobacteria bacterium]|nr:LysR family transcriptional regulator [Deltaproteobacteria bacterium]MBL7203677.1 LysR family transcriptional regulator [Desulfobacteraceae bacterium]
MDIGSLRIFKAVADEGSVSKAAARVHCVQSNVTARLRQLEGELDTPLFYRKKRGMALTPPGKILLGYADRAIRLLVEAEKAVKDTGSVKGPLSIGAMESTAAVRLPSVLSRYYQKYPEVELILTTGTSEELIQFVLDYKLDGAFVGGPVENAEIDQEPMFKEELVIVTDGKVRSLKSVENPIILVFRKGCSYRAILENLLRETGIVPYKIMEFGTLEGILGCVSAGMGITLFPHSVIAKLNYAEKVKVHRISQAIGRVPTMFVRRKNAVLTKALDAFLHTVREEDDSPLIVNGG